jgi:hypothetical protein
MVTHVKQDIPIINCARMEFPCACSKLKEQSRFKVSYLSGRCEFSRFGVPKKRRQKRPTAIALTAKEALFARLKAQLATGFLDRLQKLGPR